MGLMYRLQNKETAKAKPLFCQKEVMTMISATLDSAGITQEINRKDGTRYARTSKLYAMDRNTQAQEMNRTGATPNIAISPLPPKMVIYYCVKYRQSTSRVRVWCAGVIFIVGTQKL